MEMEEESKEKKKVPVLPWMRNPIDVSSFGKCPLEFLPFIDPRLVEALRNMGFSSLFPVQLAVWNETIGPGSFERDICVNTPTGSGKTLAYALPIVQALSTRAVKCLRALVVVPSIGLAKQVKEVFASIATAVGLSVGLAVGKSSIANEVSELIKRPKLEAGIRYEPDYLSPELHMSVDILVATPGRLMDHINNTKGFTLEHLCYLVVDEADGLFEQAFQSWLPTVLKLTNLDGENPNSFPKSCTPSPFGSLRTIRTCGVERGFKGKPFPRLVKVLLSATLTQHAGKLAQVDLHHPLLLRTGSNRYQLPENLRSYKLICEPNSKPLHLVALLQSFGEEKCIVFTSSVERTHLLFTLLNSFSILHIKIGEYFGGQPQYMKSKTLQAFRNGKLQVLVCSDVLARGMDIEGVKNVINYDMPVNKKKYVHRAGRAARAGQTGHCYTLVYREQVKPLKRFLQKVDCDSCPEYTIPKDSIESLRGFYTPALESMAKTIESEVPGKQKSKSNSSRPGRKKTNHSKE